MRRLVLVLILAVLCAGCAAVDWLRARPEGRSEAAQLVARAEELVHQGQPGPARDLYAQVAGMPLRDAVHARALYNLARLYESLGEAQHAIRHLGQYRRLTSGEAR